MLQTLTNGKNLCTNQVFKVIKVPRNVPRNVNTTESVYSITYSVTILNKLVNQYSLEKP